MTLENISLCENGNIELCDNGNISFCTVLVELTHCNNLAHSNCDGSEASIITELEASHVGKIVRIGDICYSVAEVESGTPVAVTIDEVYDDCAECCSDLAPCSCPCTSWPGAYPWDAEDEPCSGLLDEYIVDNNLQSTVDGTPIYYYRIQEDEIVEYRLNAPASIYAISVPCSWTGRDASVAWRDIPHGGSPSSWSNSTRTIRLHINAFAWEEYSLAISPDMRKPTGQTPVGAYDSTWLAPPPPAGNTVQSILITEPT